MKTPVRTNRPHKDKDQIKEWLKDNLGEPLRVGSEKFNIAQSSLGRYWNQVYNELYNGRKSGAGKNTSRKR